MSNELSSFIIWKLLIPPPLVEFPLEGILSEQKTSAFRTFATTQLISL